MVHTITCIVGTTLAQSGMVVSKTSSPCSRDNNKLDKPRCGPEPISNDEVVRRAGLGPLLAVTDTKSATTLHENLFNENVVLRQRVIQAIQLEDGIHHNISSVVQGGSYQGGCGSSWFDMQEHLCEYVTVSLAHGVIEKTKKLVRNTKSIIKKSIIKKNDRQNKSGDVTDKDKEVEDGDSHNGNSPNHTMDKGKRTVQNMVKKVKHFVLNPKVSYSSNHCIFRHSASPDITVGFPVVVDQKLSNGSTGDRVDKSNTNLKHFFNMKTASWYQPASMVILMDHTLRSCTETGKLTHGSDHVEKMRGVFGAFLVSSAYNSSVMGSKKSGVAGECTNLQEWCAQYTVAEKYDTLACKELQQVPLITCQKPVSLCLGSGTGDNFFNQEGPIMTLSNNDTLHDEVYNTTLTESGLSVGCGSLGLRTSHVIQTTSVINEWAGFDTPLVSSCHDPRMVDMIGRYFNQPATTNPGTKKAVPPLGLLHEMCVHVSGEDKNNGSGHMLNLQHKMCPRDVDKGLAVVVVSSISNPDKYHTHVAILDLKRREGDGSTTHFNQKNFLASFVVLAKQALGESSFECNPSDITMTEYDNAKISSSLAFYWGQLLTRPKPGRHSVVPATDIQVGMSVTSTRHLPLSTSVVCGKELSLPPSKVFGSSMEEFTSWMHKQCVAISDRNTVPLFHKMMSNKVLLSPVSTFIPGDNNVNTVESLSIISSKISVEQ